MISYLYHICILFAILFCLIFIFNFFILIYFILWVNKTRIYKSVSSCKLFIIKTKFAHVFLILALFWVSDNRTSEFALLRSKTVNITFLSQILKASIIVQWVMRQWFFSKSVGCCLFLDNLWNCNYSLPCMSLFLLVNFKWHFCMLIMSHSRLLMSWLSLAQVNKTVLILTLGESIG